MLNVPATTCKVRYLNAEQRERPKWTHHSLSKPTAAAAEANPERKPMSCSAYGVSSQLRERTAPTVVATVGRTESTRDTVKVCNMYSQPVAK